MATKQFDNSNHALNNRFFFLCLSVFYFSFFVSISHRTIFISVCHFQSVQMDRCEIRLRAYGSKNFNANANARRIESNQRKKQRATKNTHTQNKVRFIGGTIGWSIWTNEKIILPFWFDLHIFFSAFCWNLMESLIVCVCASVFRSSFALVAAINLFVCLTCRFNLWVKWTKNQSTRSKKPEERQKEDWITKFQWNSHFIRNLQKKTAHTHMKWPRKYFTIIQQKKKKTYIHTQNKTLSQIRAENELFVHIDIIFQYINRLLFFLFGFYENMEKS